MEVKATAKYQRTSPRKLRLMTQAIKGLSVRESLIYLEQTAKSAALPLRKVISSALANAKHNHNLAEETLKIKKIEIQEGPIYKRIRPVSRGRAHSIKKRTAHLMVVLEGSQNGTKS